MKRLHAIVEGRVQGVNFRSFVQQHAQQMQVTGWVRNLPDGTVEVLAEGEDYAITRLVIFLEKGPPQSRVDHVATEYGMVTGEFTTFVVRE